MAINFLREYQRYYRSVCDGPDKFAAASAYAAAGLILADKIRLNWAAQSLRPNLWIVLTGPSTALRKTTSVNIAASVASFAGIRFTLDTTREAAMARLSTGRLDILAREWASVCESFMAEYNSGLIERLTEAYDGDPVGGDRLTMKHGAVTISSPIVTITGASTADWIGRALHKRADIAAGWMARFITVYVPERDRPERRPGALDRKWALWLYRSALRLTGEMSLSDRAFYCLEEATKQISALRERLIYFPRLCDRAQEHMLKLSMLEAACEYSRTIQPSHTRGPVEFILDNVQNTLRLEKALAASPFVMRAEQLRDIVVRHGPVSYRDILKHFIPRSAREVVELLTFLRDAGLIVEETAYVEHGNRKLPIQRYRGQ